MVSLIRHPRGYRISCGDCGHSLITLFSGRPYAVRHFELANRPNKKWVQRVHQTLGYAESIPIIGLLVAVIERIVALVQTCFANKLSQSASHSRKLQNRVTREPSKTVLTDVEMERKSQFARSASVFALRCSEIETKFESSTSIEPWKPVQRSFEEALKIMLDNFYAAMNEYSYRTTILARDEMTVAIMKAVLARPTHQLNLKTYTNRSKGYRAEQQDSLITFENDRYWFGVIADGHGEFGHKVSEFICTEIKKRIFAVLAKHQNNVFNAMNELQYEINREVLNNKKWLTKQNDGTELMLSGSTLVWGCLDRYTKILIAPNTGDSKMFVHRKGMPIGLSRVHKPYFPREADRCRKYPGFSIDKDAAYLTHDIVKGVGVAVTRAVGYGFFTPVNAEPESSIFLVEEGDVIYMHSDGADYIDEQTRANLIQSGKDIAKKFVKAAKDSFPVDKKRNILGDNVSVITAAVSLGKALT